MRNKMRLTFMVFNAVFGTIFVMPIIALGLYIGSLGFSEGLFEFFSTGSEYSLIAITNFVGLAIFGAMALFLAFDIVFRPQEYR